MAFEPLKVGAAVFGGSVVIFQAFAAVGFEGVGKNAEGRVVEADGVVVLFEVDFLVLYIVESYVGLDAIHL